MEVHTCACGVVGAGVRPWRGRLGSHRAYDCFEENGLMVFGSTGCVDCIDRTTYAMRHSNEDGSVAVTDLNDPAALLD